MGLFFFSIGHNVSYKNSSRLRCMFLSSYTKLMRATTLEFTPVSAVILVYSFLLCYSLIISSLALAKILFEAEPTSISN